MYDCNLIKSRAQKMQDFQLPSIESTYSKMRMPMIPGMPTFPKPVLPTAPPTPAPTAPAAPAGPILPPTPEAEIAFPLSPLLPRILPEALKITVPANPLLPEAYATILDYESLQYMNGYLRTQIGKTAEVVFLIGSTNIITKRGRLTGVGLNYILLEDLATGEITSCDFYTIKFIITLANNGLSPEG